MHASKICIAICINTHRALEYQGRRTRNHATHQMSIGNYMISVTPMGPKIHTRPDMSMWTPYNIQPHSMVDIYRMRTLRTCALLVMQYTPPLTASTFPSVLYVSLKCDSCHYISTRSFRNAPHRHGYPAITVSSFTLSEYRALAGMALEILRINHHIVNELTRTHAHAYAYGGNTCAFIQRTHQGCLPSIVYGYELTDGPLSARRHLPTQNLSPDSLVALDGPAQRLGGEFSPFTGSAGSNQLPVDVIRVSFVRASVQSAG